ncbi:MAG: cofactor-independent phosphoglycerate mutase, partial [Syntrophomonadaceae bacterium]|nr:cofactor-independent phosphoglycerate mutase [Syntrophomonadaceae bacterium]
MKYVVVLADGMADYSLDELGQRTPLEYAHTPNFDRLAAISRLGMVKTVPDGMPPGSDVANLSVLGYDPAVYYTGRSPLEAVSMGVDLAEGDAAFRCNLVTLSEEPEYRDRVMVDYSADEISTDEARELINEVGRQLGSEEFSFYAGISYRHLMVWRGGSLEVELTPPHDIPGKRIESHLPRGRCGPQLLALMQASPEILDQHPVNRRRIKNGQRPANSIWFWGEGRKPSLSSFADKFGLNGSVVCAVDLIRGLGVCAGLKPVRVPGATGGIVTNFLGKAQAAIRELLGGQDFVFIHIEAPDEAGHRGELDSKVRAIESIDREVVGEIVSALEGIEY